jgi:hypothetical protein
VNAMQRSDESHRPIRLAIIASFCWALVYRLSETRLGFQQIQFLDPKIAADR